MISILKKIPHVHIWKETRFNGLNAMCNEKTCRLCGSKIHLPFDKFLKGVWKKGPFE